MGLITLSEFRERLDVTLGDRNLSSDPFDDAINDAYMEIAGGVEFKEFEAIHQFVTVDGTISYALPAVDIAAVEFIVRTSDFLNLRWVSKGEFLRLDPGDATPTVWTRIGDSIYLNPTPDAAYGIDLHYRTMPGILSADADVTEISRLWDQPVYLLAVHYMWMALGEEDRGVVWYQRALAALQSRMTEDDFAKTTFGKINARLNTTPETQD